MSRDPNETVETDRRCIEEILNGDTSAFSELFEKYCQSVRRLGGKILRRVDELDDFVQEVFLKVYLKISTLRNTGGVRSWIMRIAFTTALNLKQRNRTPVPVDPSIVDQSLADNRVSGPPRQLEQKSIYQAVLDALAELPLHYQNIISLLYGYNLKYKEIAELTGTPLGTLKSHASRARVRLRSLLENTVASQNGLLFQPEPC